VKPGFRLVPPGSYYYMKPSGFTVTKMNRKFTALIVMTLLATSATGLDLIPVQAKGPRDQSAETMLGLLEQSQAEVTALFDSITAAGGQVPEGAQEQLQEAIQLQVEAQAHYDAGEIEECIEKATDALNAYGKAASKANEAEDEVEDEEDEGTEDNETEKNLGLFTAVDRARAYLDKLRSIATDLESQGIDVTEAKSLLDQAEAALDSAEEALNQGDFETAEGLLEEARSLMGQATGDLRSLSEPKKKEKMEHFVNQTMIRVRHLEDKMLRILSKYGVTEEDTQALTAEFQALIAALEGVDVDRDDLDDVVDQLKGLVKDSHEFGKDFDEVEDETIERLNDVSKLEAKLNRYRERLHELEQLGYNTGNVTAVYTEAEGLLEEAMVMLESGDREAAEELIDRVDEMLDDIDDMVDDAEDEAESDDDDKGKPGHSYEEKLADIQEKVDDYAEKIERLKAKGENTTGLEAKLEEIRQALEEAASDDDLEEVESMLDELDDLIDGSDDDHGTGSKDDDEDEVETEEEPEEEPEEESEGEGEGPSPG